MKKSLIFFLLSTIFSFAQSIKGTVLDDITDEKLVGANIYLKNAKTGTVANRKGEFKFKIDINDYSSDTLVISHVGYVTKTISVSKLKEKNNLVYLIVDVQNLNKVSVYSKSNLRRSIRYNRLTPLKRGLYSFGSILINDKIYVIGGNNSYERDGVMEALYLDRYVDPNASIIDIVNQSNYNLSWEHYSEDMFIYDTNSNTWQTSDLKFRKRANVNMHFYDGEIYILGGKRLSLSRNFEYLDDKIEVFNIEKGTILIDNVNPHQAVNFASFIKDENIIFIGGSIKMKNFGGKVYSDIVHLFDLKTGLWYELAKMPNPKEVKGILVDDKIFLIGGYRDKALKGVQSYDLTTGKWKEEGKLFKGIIKPALAYHNGIIYIYENGSLITYDIKTKELNEYLIELYLKSSEIFYANNKLYLLGGYLEDEVSKSPSPNLYEIEMVEFEKTKIKNSAVFK